MIPFLLKASLVITIFLIFYKAFLEKESFFAMNRIYLLGSLLLTFVLPFISLPKLMEKQGVLERKIEQITFVEAPYELNSGSNIDQSKPEGKTIISDPNFRESPNGEKGLAYWLMALYYFGVVLFSLNLIVQIASVLFKVRNSDDKIEDIDCTIVNSKSIKEPCSFFNFVFINPESYDHATYEQILSHEKIHVKKFHSLDLLMAEIAIIILWFNPIVWLFRKEVEKNLEYQTDDTLVNGASVKKENYQMNLLKIATLRKPLTITTNYNQSLIKKRILKMETKKSNPHSYWKYAFVAPLVFLMLLSTNTPLETIQNKGAEAIAQNEGRENTLVGDKDCRGLLRAVKDQNIAKVKELLRTVNPNCLYEGEGEPRSPLVSAARNGNLEIGRLLVDAKADVEFHHGSDESPLMAASANGHLDFVIYLLNKGADINRKVSGDGTALLVASRNGHLEITKYLISKKADVNGQVGGDGTPLICAVRSGHYEIAKLLLENNADPYLASPGDEYPMYHARMANNKRMIDLLKKYEQEN